MGATDLEYTKYITLPGVVPPWLRRTWGKAFLQTFAYPLDALGDEHVAAVQAPWPWLAPSDALYYIGTERQLEKYPGEDEEIYRIRLWNAWDTWRLAGTEEGLLDQLYLATASIGLTDITIRYNRDWEPAPPDGNTDWWSRFWVVIGEPHPWEMAVWGEGSWGDGRLWGASITIEQINLLKRVIKQWKASHSYCEAILIQFGEYEMSFPVRA